LTHPHEDHVLSDPPVDHVGVTAADHEGRRTTKRPKAERVSFVASPGLAWW
jgi:hypothetical protein